MNAANVKERQYNRRGNPIHSEETYKMAFELLRQGQSQRTVAKRIGIPLTTLNSRILKMKREGTWEVRV